MSVYFAKKFRPKKHKFSLKIIDFLQIFIILTPYQVDENFFVFMKSAVTLFSFCVRHDSAKTNCARCFAVQTVADFNIIIAVIKYRLCTFISVAINFHSYRFSTFSCRLFSALRLLR